MSNLFSHAIGIGCPDCPPTGKRQRKPPLECSERNYSGCGVDIGHCTECGHAFEVQFKVDKLIRIPDWDGPSRLEVETEEVKEREEEAAQQLVKDQAEFERLKQKLGK